MTITPIHKQTRAKEGRKEGVEGEGGKISTIEVCVMLKARKNGIFTSELFLPLYFTCMCACA